MYTFVDYAPKVFRALRRHYGTEEDDYLASVGIEQLIFRLVFCGEFNTYQQLGSHGKSGSIFFYTHDARFMIKTIHTDEATCLKEMLLQYYRHVTSGDSLLVPVLGLFKVTSPQLGRGMYLIVMKNIFTTPNKIEISFDLKGSEVNRHVEKKTANLVSP